MSAPLPKRTLPVWDLPVRLFHWSLVLAVATALLSGFVLPVNWLNIHLWAGSAAGVLILARMVWGVTGGTYARFRNFTLSPTAVVAHLRDIVARRVHREGGHNPLGSWMVVALLGTLTFLVGTGLVVLGGMFKQGPGKAWLSFAWGDSTREIHEMLAWLLLAMIAGHLLGVLFESLRSGENLARAMVTGRKPEGFEPARHSFVARKGVALGVLAAGTLLVGSAVIGANALPPRGVPAVMPDAAWAKDCGDCHMAFHPTLLPAQSWQQIMARLDDHFGEDASLPADEVQAITAFLTANSAETSDSFAANRFRRVNPGRPMEITATPFWHRRHSGIADAVFAAAPVNSRQNCAACHSDAAAGGFAPQNISIPKETLK